MTVCFLAPIGLTFLDERWGSVRNPLIVWSALSFAWLTWRRIPLATVLAQRPSRPLLLLAFGAGAVSFWTSSMFHFWGLRLNGEDFSIFDYMLFNTNHRVFMTTPICNMARPLELCHHFGVHPSYILIPLAWLHRLWPTPTMLISVHALAIYSAVIPLWRLSIRHLGSEALAIFVTLAYLSNGYTGAILNHSFHMEALYIPIGMWLLVGWVERRPSIWIPAMAFFLSIKEDAALALVGFAVGAALWQPRRRLAAAWIAVVSVAIFCVNSFWVQPFFLERFGADQPFYLRFWDQYGATKSAVVWGMLSHPWRVLVDVAGSGWLQLFGLALFLPLLHPVALCAMLPTLVLYGASNNPHLRDFATYYPSIILPFYFWALVAGVRRFDLSPLLLVASCLVFMHVGGGYQRFPRPNPQALRDLAAIERTLGPHPGPVCAQTIFFPHLPYEWDARPLSAECLSQPGATGIAAAEGFDPYPFAPDQIAAFIGVPRTQVTYRSRVTVFSR